jgi:hypothetical protein
MISKYELSVDTINEVLHYLSGKPYIEVHQIIAKIKEEAALFELSQQLKQKESDGLTGSN